MKKIGTIIALLIYGITISEKAHADKFYWVGGAGNWSDIAHWGKYSGAPMGSGSENIYTRLPIASDTVIFDNNSGFSTTNDASRTITLDALGECHDLLFQGSNVKPIFNLKSTLIIAGFLYLQPGMTFSSSTVYNSTHAIYFGATSFAENKNYIITTNGVKFPDINIVFRGNSGTGGQGTWTTVGHFKTSSSNHYSVTVSDGKWIAQDSVSLGNMYFTGGTVDWSGQNVSLVNFKSDNVNTRSLDIRNASVLVDNYSSGYSLEIWNYTGTGSSLLADGSSLQFNNKAITGFGSSATQKMSITFEPLHHYNKIITDSPVVRAGLFINTSFLTDTLIVRAHTGLIPGSTATVNKYLEATGCKRYISLSGYNGSASGTKTAYIVMGTGTTNVNNIILQDVHISGNSAAYSAGTSANIGENIGWSFTTATGTNTCYWVGGAGEWDDINHWSASSGGTPGNGCLPMTNDNVVFDANSGFTAASKAVTMERSYAFCHNMTWNTPLDIKPELKFGYQPSHLYVYGSMELQKDMSITITYSSYGPGITMKSGHAATIATKGVVFPQSNNYYPSVIFDGTGTWTMTDDFNSRGAVQFLSGNIVMSGKNVNLGGFLSDNSNTRTLDIRNSVITLSDNIVYKGGAGEEAFTGWCYKGANSGLQAAGAHLIMNADGNYYYCNAVNGDMAHTYNKISFLRDGGVQDYLRTDTLALESAGNKINFHLFRSSSSSIASTVPHATVNKYFKADDCHTFKEIRPYNNSSSEKRSIEFTSGCKVGITNATIDRVNTEGGPYTVLNCTLKSATGWNNIISNNIYYWVGGEGDWNDGMHWANQSGGPAGSGCVPYIGDSAVFDDKSGFDVSSYKVTVTNEAYCKGMKWHNMGALTQKPELNLATKLNVYGSVELQNGMSITSNATSNVINMCSNASPTLKSNGAAISCLTYSGTGTLKVLDDLRVSAVFAMSGGNGAKIDMSNINAVLGAFNSNYYATGRSLDIQNSVIELTYIYNEYSWSAGYISNLSTAGSTLIFNNSYDADKNSLSGDATHTYNKVIFMKSGIISSNVTIDSLFIGDSNTSNITLQVTYNRIVTINKYLESVDCRNFKTFKSNSSTQATINIQPGAVINMDHTVLASLNFTNPATVYNCIDGGSNTGITFGSTSKTYYWVGGAGNWNDASHWATSTGGGGGACVPLAGDNIVFDNQSGFMKDGDTVRISSTAYCLNMTWHNMSSNYPHFEVNANLYIYGSLEWQRNMTVNIPYPAKINFVAPDAVTIKSNGVVIKGNMDNDNSSIEFNSASGKWTVTDDFALLGGLGFITGHIEMRGINVSLYYLLSNSSGKMRKLDISNSSIRINNPRPSSNAWTHLYANAELSAAGSVIYINTYYTSAFDVIASHNYNKIVLESNARINATAVVDTLILKQNSGANLSLNSYMSLTVNKYLESLHCSGFNELKGGTSSSILNMGTDAKVNINHLQIDVPVQGDKAPYRAVSSLNLANHAGWDTSQGTDVYWVGGAGRWIDPLHWASSSGGTGGTGCKPSTADNVFFDEKSGLNLSQASNRTVKIDGEEVYCRDMIWHNMGSQQYKPILDGQYTSYVYGSIEFQEGMTATYSGQIRMRTSDSVTIKSNGVQNQASFYFEGTGAYKILDDFINTYSGNNTYFISGRLYMNGITAVIGDFSYTTNTSGRYLDIRNSNISAKSWRYTGDNNILLADSSRINLTSENKLNTAKGFRGVKAHTYDTVVLEKRSCIFGGTMLNTLILAQGFDSSNDFYFIAGDTVTINRKFITGGTPCDVVRISPVATPNGTPSTSPAYICVPVSEYNTDPDEPTGFDLNSAEVSYIHILEGADKAKVRLTNVSREAVLNSNTGGWIMMPYTGLEGVTLGKDTTMWCNSSFFISTYRFYGDHNTKYLWNDGSTEDHLNIADSGTYWVEVSYSANCKTSDTLYVSRINDIQLTGAASPVGGQVRISLSTSGLSSFDPNPVFVLDSVQPAGAMSGLPLVQYSPDFYFPVGVRAFFSHTDSLSGCRAVYETITPLTAVNDSLLLFNYNPVEIAVLDNDIYFLEAGYCTSANAVLSEQVTAQHGAALLQNDTLRYTPDYGWTGIDSLDYVLTSCGAKDTARVYIIVFRDTYDACPGKSVTMELPDIPAMTYVWRDAQTGGAVVTTNRTYTVVKDSPLDIGAWWVEVTWNGMSYLNFPVSLLPGSASVAAYISKFTGDTVILSGNSTTLTAHAVPMVVNPYYEWYDEASGGMLFNTGDTYTTSLLTDDTTFYVTVLGDNVCSSSERKAVTVHIIKPPEGAADYYSTPVNTDVVCDVLVNDVLSDVCTNPDINVVTPATSGTANVTNGKIVYTPNTNVYGIDNIEYEIDCGIIQSSPVEAHILVYKPLFQKYRACENAEVTLGFHDIAGVTYNWYDSPTGTTPITNGSHTNTVTVTKDDSPSQTWWAEPVYAGVAYPRIEVVLQLGDEYVAPDLRLQICPSPPAGRTVRLSSYLEPSDYSKILWEQVSPYPVITDTETGLIVNGNFQKNATYTYKYTLTSPENSGCGSTTAKVYVRTLNNRILGKTVDTIVICSALDNSKTVSLNQIFGLEIDGAWSYPNDPDNITENNVTVYSLPSQYAGAHVFNAQKAYSEANSNYNITYRNTPGKRFEFVYTTTVSSCVNETKKIVLVVMN